MFATIYTDASQRGGDYGYSYYTRCDKGRHSGTGIVLDADCCDINYAEMYCIIKGIEESTKKFKGISRILVVTDSQVAQYTLWKNHQEDFFENGHWNSIIYGNPSGSRKDKYKNLVERFEELEKDVEKIMIKWTKGHRSDSSDRAYLNNKCDERASRAIRVHQKRD